MRRPSLRRSRFAPRFAVYAIACAVPVILLGVALAASFRRETRREGTTGMAMIATSTRSAMGGSSMSAPTGDHVPSMAEVMSGLRDDAAVDRHTDSVLIGAVDRDLVLGLGGLYLLLFVITACVGRRLRRDAARNEALASNDALTGLPNRISFTRAVAEALHTARLSDIPVGVALIDLDRFKLVNDALGHRNGDAVLCELASRLSALLGDEALVARLGGDEFGVVLAPGVDSASTLQRVHAMFDREVRVAGLALHAPASIGYVLAPDDGADVDTLLQRADIAMYAAKDGRLGVARYAAGLEQYDAATLGLVAELRRGIEDDQLVLHYQPLLHHGSDSVVALEALVRWQHPEHGLLFPDRFLALAEQTDDIECLTAWVLRRALRDIDGLGAEYGSPRVAVNVSPRSLGRGKLADEVLAALRELSVAPDRLIIEVTETAILADPGRAAHELRRLADAGVRISLDDFGQGQTSLSHLSALPLHELKIDRAFVGDMDSDVAHAAIVRSMIELGHNLGLQVVAEGVETEAVSDQLREAGSDLVQGYLLSRPLPREQITDWLARRAADIDASPAAPTGAAAPDHAATVI